MITVAVSLSMPAALNMALDDEYRAHATYACVLDTFGPVLPFANIVHAEERHIAALLPLFQRYGVAMPADRWAGRVAPFASLREACEAGVAGEIRNYQMYDRLLDDVSEPDVRMVFANLRNASAYHHLPAFAACAASASTAVLPAVSGGASPGKGISIGLGLLLGASLIWSLTRLRPVAAK